MQNTQETWVRLLGQEDTLEEEMAIQSSILGQHSVHAPHQSLLFFFPLYRYSPAWVLSSLFLFLLDFTHVFLSVLQGFKYYSAMLLFHFSSSIRKFGRRQPNCAQWRVADFFFVYSWQYSEKVQEARVTCLQYLPLIHLLPIRFLMPEQEGHGLTDKCRSLVAFYFHPLSWGNCCGKSELFLGMVRSIGLTVILSLN